jgi:hypothetical protein
MDVERRQPILHRIGEAGATIGSKPPRSKRVRLALQIGIAVVIFGFLVLTVIDQWSEIQSEGVHFHVIWLIPALIILSGFYFFSALGWDFILRFLGYPIGIGRAQVAWGQPLLARYVPGSVLYVLGRVLLSERAGVPRRITVASIVYEQAISATSAIVVAAYFIIRHPDLQGTPFRWAVLLLIPAAIVILAPRVFGPLANRLLRAFGRDPLPTLIPLRGVILLIAYYSLNWVVVAFGIYFTARSVTFIPFNDLLLVGSRRRLRLGGKGGAAERQLRPRVADLDRRPRRDDGRRTGLRRDRHHPRPPPGLVGPHRHPPPEPGGGRGRDGGRRPHPRDPLGRREISGYRYFPQWGVGNIGVPIFSPVGCGKYRSTDISRAWGRERSVWQLEGDAGA